MSNSFVNNSGFDIYGSFSKLSTNRIDVKARNCNEFDYIEIYRYK
jgi:hypothetical protein